MDYEDAVDPEGVMNNVQRRIGPAPESPGAIAWPSTREKYRHDRALWDQAAGPAVHLYSQEQLNPISTREAQGFLGPDVVEKTASPGQFRTDVGPATPNLPPDIIDMRTRFNGRTGFPPEMSEGGVLKRNPMDPGTPYTKEDAQRLNSYSEVQPGASPGVASRSLDPESQVSPFQRQMVESEMKRRSSPYYGIQRGPQSKALQDQMRAEQFADSIAEDRTSPEWHNAYSNALGYAVGANSRPMAEPVQGGQRSALMSAQTIATQRRPDQVDTRNQILQQNANVGQQRANTYQQDVDNKDARGNRGLDLRQEGLDLKRQHDQMVDQRMRDLKAKGASDQELAKQKFEFDRQFKTMILRGYLHKQGVLSAEDDATNLGEILGFATGQPAYVNPGGWFFGSPTPGRTQEEGGQEIGTAPKLEVPQASEEIKKVQPKEQPKSEPRPAPKVGEVINGYRFKGGDDTHDVKNWEKVK